MKMQVVTENIELCRLEEHYEEIPHVHENWVQLTFAVRGGSSVITQGTSGFIPEGAGIVHKPMQEHQIRVDEGSCAIVIKMRTSLWETLQHEEADCITVEQDINPRELNAEFQRWIAPLLLTDGDDRSRRSLTETGVLLYLTRNLKRGDCPDKNPPCLPELHRTGDPYMDRVLEYIHLSYTSSISIELLSSMALRSRYHFIRSFKAVTGFSPYQYILRLRIQRSKYELEYTEATISAISAGLGFASTSQFYRAFVKITGMAPEQYRLERKMG
ncbi:AraC family transcriptional regulator [Paenibacillus forsythiae]|uniref:AraC family transcriptional regulator n=1 Tax=Paenibacillus forsythiae TaxID=365616 RepID=A0ABU3H1W9_9BACL|nr:AraC family transcriptional regulator [Paenibacillus forsythiae]MDT3424823.1 AraC family transcriptional regulator [Paenibacillus forsythiae]